MNNSPPWSNAQCGSPEECWLWQRGCDQDGYGLFRHDGRTRRAHRVAWELANGRAVPSGLMVLHSCDRPGCINPAHLRVGTGRDNYRDCVERGRSISGNARKAACKRGHAFAGNNVALEKYGSRRCLACKRALDRTRRQSRGLPIGTPRGPRGTKRTHRNGVLLSDAQIDALAVVP